MVLYGIIAASLEKKPHFHLRSTVKRLKPWKQKNEKKKTFFVPFRGNNSVVTS
jgi:hypothetical protein